MVYDFDNKKVRVDLSIKLFNELKNDDLLNFAKVWWEKLKMEDKVNLWKKEKGPPKIEGG